MKRLPFFLPLVFVVTLAAGIGRESPRTWTDTKGRKVEGTLMAKTETTADVLLKSGKRTVLKLADLSEGDQDYIEKATVFPEPEMLAKTVSVDSNEAKTKSDARKVEVTVEKIHGREYELTIHWLGPDGNKVGIYKSETADLPESGKIVFSVTYKGANKKGVGGDYKGYVVGLREKGLALWSARSASQKPFERFLDSDAE
ncbi:hypothetical protein OKA05_02070 [Luteolibacter arcticus]|uniref:SLA1 homology domain-containing protein n=1 Tax=Luteolibacter arcticus TaxID=1581411 RepID=A0ABT3GCP8_9BACT|nr:hypothetical protein [Luteolibacter arcticus]MCW1921319.1 hypothetical protein [Luteolibacter arcticus]